MRYSYEYKLERVELCRQGRMKRDTVKTIIFRYVFT